MQKKNIAFSFLLILPFAAQASDRIFSHDAVSLGYYSTNLKTNDFTEDGNAFSLSIEKSFLPSISGSLSFDKISTDGSDSLGSYEFETKSYDASIEYHSLIAAKTELAVGAGVYHSSFSDVDFTSNGKFAYAKVANQLTARTEIFGRLSRTFSNNGGAGNYFTTGIDYDFTKKYTAGLHYGRSQRGETDHLGLEISYNF